MLLTLYTVVLIVFSPVVLAGFVWRFGLRRTFLGLPERFGGGTRKLKPEEKNRTVIWTHAASVGEVRAVEAFLRLLPERIPGVVRCLTTTTVNGRDLAESLDIAETVHLAPADYPFCVGRFLNRWSPKALVLVETELWPHWIHTARKQNVPVLIVNGRLSERSLRSYRLLPGFWRPILESIARIGAQSPGHAARWQSLGGKPSQIVVTGNLKYDVALPDPAQRAAIFRKYGFAESDYVLVCGSTHAGEEEILIDAVDSLRKRGEAVKLVLAPRHVERAAESARLLHRANLPFRVRSAHVANPESFPVMVLDTLGELQKVYGLASAAFVGGSLIRRGGQNPLEPARWGVPVIFGPSMENFQEMADLFLERKGAVQVADGKALEELILAWKRDPAAARTIGNAARATALSQGGSVEKSVALLQEVLRSARP